VFDEIIVNSVTDAHSVHFLIVYTMNSTEHVARKLTAADEWRNADVVKVNRIQPSGAGRGGPGDGIPHGGIPRAIAQLALWLIRLWLYLLKAKFHYTEFSYYLTVLPRDAVMHVIMYDLCVDFCVFLGVSAFG